MNNNTFSNSIRRYILEGDGEDKDMDIDVDADIDLFEITKFNYRTLFDKRVNQNISHTEMVFKFFGIENISDVDTVPQKHKWYFDDHPDEWKQLFIFFCVMPFTEYEFEGSDGRLLNPDTLRKIGLSQATDNDLIRTFSDIEFESLNQEILEDRLAANLQCILRTDLFSNTFSKEQRKNVISNLLFVSFQLKHKIVTNIRSNAESTYKNNFMNYLFRPICEYIASVLRFPPQVEEENTIGQTGVHTRVPHQSNDLFYSHPDIVAYAKKVHYQSLALVEVKRLPILKGRKRLEFANVKIKRFLKQVVAEMFSNHTNKGMLTDSYTTILIEMDIERTLENINHNTGYWNDDKPIALNYKILDCQSSGLTLRGGLMSYIYEAFVVDEPRLGEIKRGLNVIYKFIRKTDEEYLTYLDELASKDKISFMEHCINAIENHHEQYRRRRLFITEIGLGNFDDIDVQSGFTFNSQIFKVNTKYVTEFLKGNISEHDQFIVKVFDPIKAKRDHKDYRDKQTDIFEACRRAYLCEKLAYENLSNNFLFNNVYVDQKWVFGTFNIGTHYHALGPFLILKYIEQRKEKYDRLPKDRATYEKAEEQLEIIHNMGIIHGDICERNILYSKGEIYFIDFGYSDYFHDKKGSRPASANLERRKSEHRKLCRVFHQLIPGKYEYRINEES